MSTTEINYSKYAGFIFSKTNKLSSRNYGDSLTSAMWYTANIDRILLQKNYQGRLAKRLRIFFIPLLLNYDVKYILTGR